MTALDSGHREMERGVAKMSQESLKSFGLCREYIESL